MEGQEKAEIMKSELADAVRAKYMPGREGSSSSLCVRHKPEICPLIADHLKDQLIPASGREKTGDGSSNRKTDVKDRAKAERLSSCQNLFWAL